MPTTRKGKIMQLSMYSIRDAKAGFYHHPIFEKHNGEALESFTQLANDPKTPVCKYPEDYDLYYLGTYDDHTGLVQSLPTPEHVQKAVQLKKT